jgi:hypothetical protein
MELILTSKVHGVNSILFDVDDYDKIMEYHWYVYKKNSSTYAYAHIKRNGIYTKAKMHRVVTDEKYTMVDHINGDGLDNRKCNLRPCSHTENMRNSKIRKDNSSGYRGVSWCKRDKIWKACIQVNGKHLSLKSGKTAKEAALLYNEGAKKYHGKFARLNIIEDICP